MKLAKLMLASLIVASLGALVGCDLLDKATGSQVIGSIVAWYGTMDPYADYDTAPRAVSLEGAFPGAPTDSYDSITYQFGDIPAGEYTVFAWIDSDGDGLFSASFDLFGFYFGDPGSYNLAQPAAANVIVPETGIVDLDLRVGYNAG
jgi:hypothetical protein